MTLHFNDGWYFSPEFTSDMPRWEAQQARALLRVRLPHTVRELPLRYLNEGDYQMVSAYLRPLTVPEGWAGRRVLLHFGAAAHEAAVYCNGALVCTHRCGYTAFTAELTEHLRFGGENLIAVRLDSRESLDQPPFGHAIDYLTYGGIYRGVTLEIAEQSRISDVFIHADHRGETRMEIRVENPGSLRLAGRVLGPDGKRLGRLDGRACHSHYRMAVPKPPVWSIDTPKLCTLELELRDGERIVDQRSVRFGFRTVFFGDDGFFLNGEPVKLRGLNRHQCWPYIGYAAPDRAQALDADILKYELGCNIVRTSHYPQSHAFVSRCDEIGLLVFTEIPGWQHIGGETWQDVCVENVREMVTEYRNHPSIILWGVRINESADCDALYRRTNAMAHSLDPSRPTGGVRNFKKSHLFEDVYTYNDFVHSGANAGCEPKKRVTSDMAKGYMITEYNGHMFPTKSFDHEGKRLEHALRHCRVLDAVRSHPDIAGSTGWCMFDYNTHQDFGSGDRICHHGVMDAFRNSKLAAFAYAAEGCPEPVLAVSSSMDIGDHPGGCLGDIYAFTNAEEVRLYKNGDYVASFRGSRDYPHMRCGPIAIDDRVGALLEKEEGFDPATARQISWCLGAIGKYGLSDLPPQVIAKLAAIMLRTGLRYDDGVRLYGKYVAGWGDKMTSWRFAAVNHGVEVASVTREPVQSVHLEAKADTAALCESGTWDMATIRIRAADQNGNTLPYCDRVVSASIEGPLALIGPAQFALSGGMLGTYVRTTGQSGRGRLTLNCEGMEPVAIDFDITVEERHDSI